MSTRQVLRELMNGKDPFIAADCYSALTARIIEHIGFKAAYMGGHATGMMHYAVPDCGVLTPTEMIEQAARVAETIAIPVIVDADQAGESVADVYRSVGRYERSGVAGIHIEDEIAPKHSAYDGPLLSISDMQARIGAASRRSIRLGLRDHRPDRRAVRGRRWRIGVARRGDRTGRRLRRGRGGRFPADVRHRGTDSSDRRGGEDSGWRVRQVGPGHAVQLVHRLRYRRGGPLALTSLRPTSSSTESSPRWPSGFRRRTCSSTRARTTRSSARGRIGPAARSGERTEPQRCCESIPGPLAALPWAGTPRVEVMSRPFKRNCRGMTPEEAR